MDKIHLDHADLLSRIHYDPETGIFTRLTSSGKNAVGSVAGFQMPTGHIIVKVRKFRLIAAQLAYFYMTGSWPPEVMDHINRDASDNRWCNLRATSQANNRKNNSLPRHNTSGVLGVQKGRGGKWMARIEKNGKQIWLGEYETVEEAAAVRQAKALEMWGEFAPKAV